MIAIKEGEIYSCKVPWVRGAFDVVVLKRLKYNGFLVEAIDYNEEQKKALKKKKFTFVAKGSSLTERTEKIKIEIGKIYFCELPELDKQVEVEILENWGGIDYLVRVIRCTFEQRQILSKTYRSRFLVTEEQIVGESFNFRSPVMTSSNNLWRQVHV